MNNHGLSGIETPTQAISNFLKAFPIPVIGGQRPVFSNGKQVGYFKNDDDLCAGKITVTVAGGNAGAPETWTTKDDLWRDVKVTDYCLGRAKRPPWVTDTQVTQYQQQPSGALVLKDSPAKYMPWIIAGGVAAVGLILILRR